MTERTTSDACSMANDMACRVYILRRYSMMVQCFIIVVLIFMMSGCNFRDGNSEQKKDFYNTIGGWDIKHIPIIPPFRVSCAYPGQWLINGPKELLQHGKNRSGSIAVHSFGVSKNYIYGKTEDDQWFLFNVNSYMYSEYLTENELSETLKIYDLYKNNIETCDHYFQQLSENIRCYWYPETGDAYPTFAEYAPDKVYTILVDGKEKVTGFKLNETIKKTVSKLYYFKIQYDNAQNDLFYISFDYSAPRLINNDEIFAAYAEDNRMLTISVYTPYPVGQSKGIEEKDRIVITRLIELR